MLQLQHHAPVARRHVVDQLEHPRRLRLAQHRLNVRAFGLGDPQPTGQSFAVPHGHYRIN
ncbi:MAG TPA: hypothetical protein VFA35_05950 [Burkholderiaceae bacterium]|nr:hypothetical protein [Burkholderiaceae bacterium]